MKGTILTCIFCLFGLLGLTQHPILAQFTAQQIGGTVRIDFGIKGGSSCDGVTLERRTATEDFEVAGLISGVCGGSEFTEYYFIEDTSPAPNQVNYYRLKLGQQGNSEELAFEFIPFETDLFVFPNPVASELNLRWINVSSETRIIRIYNNQGQLVAGDYLANSFRTTINIDFLNTGSYFAFLLDESEAVLGVQKFIKLEN